MDTVYCSYQLFSGAQVYLFFQRLLFLLISDMPNFLETSKALQIYIFSYKYICIVFWDFINFYMYIMHFC